MAGEEEKLDISKLVLGADKQSRDKIKEILYKMDRQDIKKNIYKPKIRTEIKDYKNPIVDMFSPKSVYDVINMTEKTNFYLNGMQVAALLIDDSPLYDSFNNKKIEPEIAVKGMNIKFLYFEVEE